MVRFLETTSLEMVAQHSEQRRACQPLANPAQAVDLSSEL
jgi:hypothetical protein